ncbi:MULTISPECIES: hypothetical protein [unclassified Sphingobacterium]|uniref:hypothetical protein n=1 Tax=unclassified Sphingobacterium TaxID=2609468 RepID=UPI0025FAD11B|nr:MULTISPECIES: hypothetical protein [unclassified Sphingobacterium]
MLNSINGIATIKGMEEIVPYAMTSSATTIFTQGIELLKQHRIMTTAKRIMFNGYLTPRKLQVRLCITKATTFNHRINIVFQIIVAGDKIFDHYKEGTSSQ